jgi:hypothetical protein
MTVLTAARQLAAIMLVVVLAVSGCAFHGANS